MRKMFSEEQLNKKMTETATEGVILSQSPQYAAIKLNELMAKVYQKCIDSGMKWKIDYITVDSLGEHDEVHGTAYATFLNDFDDPSDIKIIKVPLLNADTYFCSEVDYGSDPAEISNPYFCITFACDDDHTFVSVEAAQEYINGGGKLTLLPATVAMDEVLINFIDATDAYELQDYGQIGYVDMDHLTLGEFKDTDKFGLGYIVPVSDMVWQVVH